MFASQSTDSHRLRNRDLRGSPLATHYRSTQEQTIITIHVSSAHARKDVISLFIFPEKSKNIKSVGCTAFIRENKSNVFASVRAGDVNGYDSLLLSTTVVRGEGKPRRSLLRSR